MIEQVIKKLSPEDELPHKELLSLTYGFAALVFKDDDDIRWLKWRFSLLKDILYNTWAYQELIQEGREEGFEEGFKKGFKQAVLDFVRIHFLALAQLAEKKCALLNSYEEIKALFDAIICAQSEAEARQHLQNVVKRETDKAL